MNISKMFTDTAKVRKDSFFLQIFWSLILTLIFTMTFSLYWSWYLWKRQTTFFHLGTRWQTCTIGWNTSAGSRTRNFLRSSSNTSIKMLKTWTGILTVCEIPHWDHMHGTCWKTQLHLNYSLWSKKSRSGSMLIYFTLVLGWFISTRLQGDRGACQKPGMVWASQGHSWKDEQALRWKQAIVFYFI